MIMLMEEFFFVPVSGVAASVDGSLAVFPPFDMANFISQGFWCVVCIGILFAFVYSFLFPVLNNILKLRESRIQADLNDAKTLQSEADSIAMTCDAAVASANEEANKVILNAHTVVRSNVASKTKELDALCALRLAEVDKKTEEVASVERDITEDVARSIVKAFTKNSKVDETRISEVLDTLFC